MKGERRREVTKGDGKERKQEKRRGEESGVRVKKRE